jgi:restriction endonuclease S subunit
LEIGRISTVTDGIHTSIDYCTDSNINLISATSPKNNIFDLSRQVFISEKAHTNNPRTALRSRDVIVSTVGTIGNSAVVDNSILPANSDRHVGIIRITKEYSPCYLSTFLLSKFGRFQTLRESTGNVQLNLFIYKIKEIIIPFASTSFQNNVENLVKNALAKREQANNVYADAEKILLTALNLTNFTPSTEKINVKSFNESFAKTGRLDAEYYQKKYEDILAHIKSSLPFLRVADYNKFGITQPQKKLHKSFVLNNQSKIIRLKPERDTILFSKDGSICEAYCLYEDADFVTSSAILHLKVFEPEKLLPEYLTLTLNSNLVKMQAERDVGGSIILHWRINDVQKVIIPIIDIATQTQISSLIQESFNLKAESERLLDAAKRAVEIAIEQDEQTAMKFLTEETGENLS